MPETIDNISDYRFPHLDDTAFPLLDNVNVYDYENDFDYKRWTDNVKIYLCNVLWNNDYSNVVKFVGDQERDAYFDGIDSRTVELTSAFNVAPDGSVKVPIPYQVATRYNYMYVDLPIMTSDDEPIDYEDANRTKRYYYFVNDVIQTAPSTTTLVVQLDAWTTYINNVDIPYMMLERGHAPMASVSVDTYLSSPIANNSLLLAPDVNFSEQTVVRNGKFVPINNGEKYILFATTASWYDIENVNEPSVLENVNTPANYRDIPGKRDGYQYEVLDYEWGIGNYDYGGVYVPTDTYQAVDGTIPNGMTMIAVRASDANMLFGYMADMIPYLFKTIMACFMVDESMFRKGTLSSLLGIDIWEAINAEDSLLATLKLTQSDFAYPEQYRNIAKLYTYPYSELEVTDNDGITRNIRIENTGNVQVRMATSIAFPYIRIQPYLTGVNGSGYSEYTWIDLNGNRDVLKNYSDDFGDYIWQWDIPTYALYVRGYDEYKAANYSNQWIARYDAIAEYHKTVGMDDTQRENSVDSAFATEHMTNATADTQYGNARRDTWTIYDNTVDSANTAQANANASADTAKGNADRIASTARANTALDVARNAANWSDDNVMQLHLTGRNNSVNQANQSWDAGLSRAVTSAENAQNTLAGVANGISAIGDMQNDILSSIGSLNPLGAIGAAVSAPMEIASIGISTYAACTKNDAVTEATIANTQQKVYVSNNANDDTFNEASSTSNGIMNRNNQTATSMTNNSATTTETNAEWTRTAERANAARSNATSTVNAKRVYETALGKEDDPEDGGNLGRTLDTTKANSALNRETTANNSTYTRNRAVENAQIAMEQRRIENQYAYYDARMNEPVQHGTYSGNPTLDAFERRGLQVKVRTQPNGAISQAADLMLRYGYALNQIWDVNDSGLCMMKHYTYWKCADIWINEGIGVNQRSQREIQSAFERGVTVWNDPEKIGKVSIYDNWK